VLKGPSSVLFGRGSTGGIINQVSKTPKLTPFYEISGTVGSGPQGRATLDLNQPFGGSAALRLNLMGFKGDTPGRDEVTSERWGVAPSFAIGLDGPTRLIASYFYQGDDNLPDYGLPYLRGGPAKVNTESFYGIPSRDYEHDDIHIGTLRLEHDFNENLRFRSTLRLALIERGSLVSIPAIVGTPDSLPLSAIRRARWASWWGRVREPMPTTPTGRSAQPQPASTRTQASSTSFGTGWSPPPPPSPSPTRSSRS